MRADAVELLAGAWEPEAPPPLHAWRVAPLHDEQALYCIGSDPAVVDAVAGWLRAKPERRLIFLEPRGSVWAHWIRLNGPWLRDPQVELHVLAERPDSALWARENPFQKIGVTVLPSVPPHRTFCRALREHTLREHFLFVNRLQGARLWRHALQNIAHFSRSFLVNNMADRYRGIPAVIVGAGPSLERDLETLRQLSSRALIVAGGSAIRALSAHGIAPHFALALDPNEEEITRVVSQFPVPLLYATRLHPEVLNRWRGPLGYIRAGMGGMPEAWCESELGLNCPPIHLHPESYSVTPVAVELATFFGCSSATLVGVDLAYTGGRRYAAGVEGPETREPMLLQKRDVHGNPIQTSLQWELESRALTAAARRLPLFNAGQGLAIPGVPHRPLTIQDFPMEWAFPPLDPPMAPLDTAAVQQTGRAGIERIAAHLKVLASDASLGRKALAEAELEEEPLYGSIFSEYNQLLPPLMKQTGGKRWNLLLELVESAASL